MRIMTTRSGNSLRHTSHPKMYLKKIWQLPKYKNKLIFQLKRRQQFSL